MYSNTHNLQSTPWFGLRIFDSILFLSCHTFPTLTAVYLQRMHGVKYVVWYKFENFFQKYSAPNSRVTRGNRFFLNNYTHLPNYRGNHIPEKVIFNVSIFRRFSMFAIWAQRQIEKGRKRQSERQISKQHKLISFTLSFFFKKQSIRFQAVCTSL